MWRGLGLLGVVFMALVVAREIRGGGDIAWPGLPAIVSAACLIALGLWLSSIAWIRLLGSDRSDGVHRADFFASQLGKYMPGGIWQPLGQVGLSNERGIAKGRSSSALIAHAGVQVSVGISLAFPYAFRADFPPIVRLGAALSILAPVALILGLPFLERSPRLKGTVAALGTPMAALLTAGILLVNLLLQGFAYAMLASVPLVDAIPTAVAFGVAWTIGFLAIPFPAGLGIREGVLVALVPAQAATIVAASVVARVVTIAIELLLIVLTRFRR